MIKKQHINLAIILLTFISMMGCDSTNSNDATNTITIGTNFEISGSLADVGKASQQAVELYLENAALEIDGETYQLITVLEDNKSTADGAVAAAKTLINGDNILAMIGPNASYEAVPTGAVANELQTVMISPWSTNVQTTLNRPWVYRVAFLDSFQGIVLADFGRQHYEAVNACVLYAMDSVAPKGQAESFMEHWEVEGGTLAAVETFQTGDEDLTPQLTNIKNANCDLLFLPQYAYEVPGIVGQAHEMGITIPILGSDAWAGGNVVEDCGADCNGYFFTTQFVATKASGAAAEFVNNYRSKYGETPGNVAALTWDAMLIVEQAIKNCGVITEDVAKDRLCIRQGMNAIQNLEGITGSLTFDENGDPIKCVSFVQIQDGELVYYDTICPH